MGVLAVIPARAGSKGFPGKHLANCVHKPLIQWTFDSVRDSALITDAVVTSDDPRVLAMARSSSYRFSIDDRPPSLAQDTTSTEEVLEHVLRLYSEDIIVLLQPTSPLRKGGEIDKAIKLLQDTGADSVVSVVPSHVLLWEHGKPLYTPQSRPRRQDIETRYEENGAIYVFTKDLWEREHCRIGGKTEIYVMPEYARPQVDSPYDLWLIEQTIQKGIMPLFHPPRLQEVQGAATSGEGIAWHP
jgi:CMP-N,N'-diacetyllegionaminic acid synthase